MQGGKSDEVLEGGQRFVVDQNGTGKLHDAVDHAVADDADVLHRPHDAVLLVGDGLEDQLYSDDMVGTLVLETYVGDARCLMVYYRAFLPDTLDDSAGEYVFLVPVVDLIFDGRASAIECENDHGFSLSWFKYPL